MFLAYFFALLKVDFCISPLFPERPTSSSARTDSRLVVRSARPKDLEAVAEVLTKSFHPPQGLLGWMYPFLKLGICEDLRSRLHSNTPYYACLVASLPATSIAQQQEVVGTVEIALRSSWSTNAQHLYISNLAVKTSYRRQGIAQKLLLKCEQVALEWGFQELSLHVLENNIQAKQLYSKNGYRQSQMETSLWDCLFKRPKRVLLSKRVRQ